MTAWRFKAAGERLTDKWACRTVAFRRAALAGFGPPARPEVWRFALGLRDEFRKREWPIVVSAIGRSFALSALRYAMAETDVPPGEDVHGMGVALDLAPHEMSLDPDQWTLIAAVCHEVNRRQEAGMIWGPELPADGLPADGVEHWEMRFWRPVVRPVRCARVWI